VLTNVQAILLFIHQAKPGEALLHEWLKLEFSWCLFYCNLITQLIMANGLCAYTREGLRLTAEGRRQIEAFVP